MSSSRTKRMASSYTKATTLEVRMICWDRVSDNFNKRLPILTPRCFSRTSLCKTSRELPSDREFYPLASSTIILTIPCSPFNSRSRCNQCKTLQDRLSTRNQPQTLILTRLRSNNKLSRKLRFRLTSFCNSAPKKAMKNSPLPSKRKSQV